MRRGDVGLFTLIDVCVYRTRLEMLNISHNQLEEMTELASLTALISLNLGAARV